MITRKFKGIPCVKFYFFVYRFCCSKEAVKCDTALQSKFSNAASDAPTTRQAKTRITIKDAAVFYIKIDNRVGRWLAHYFTAILAKLNGDLFYSEG